MVATSIGVEVTTGLRSGPTNTGSPAGIFHIAGLTERGPADRSVSVVSLAQYEATYGARTAYASNMYDTARMFFEEGGAELMVSRAVGPKATAGSLILQDSTGVSTAEIAAAHPGSYSSSFTVTVAETALDRFTVTISDGANTVAAFRNVASVGEMVASAASNPFINVRDLGSQTAAPGNNPVPVAGTPLKAGDDDRNAVDSAAIVAALETAEEAAAGGAVAAPGYDAEIIGAELLAHAAKFDKVALLAPYEEASASEAIAMAAALTAGAFGSYGGLFFPFLVVPDGSGTRNISPEGYIAAVRARAFNEVGFWQVPAGDRARTRWVVGTASAVNVAKNNELSAGLVNGIVTTAGRVRLYNWTSLASDRDNLALLTARDVLNNLTKQVEGVLEPLVFSTIDSKGHLLSAIESAVTSVLSPIANAGGFYGRVVGGEEVDAGYFVRVDTTNNTLETGADNTVVVQVAVRLAPTAALIKVEIVKVALGAAL